MLSMSNMPKQRIRGRTSLAHLKAEEAKPTKILTMSSLPKRRKIMNRLARKSRKLNNSQQYSERFDMASITPKIFGSYVPNGVWKGRRCFIIGGGKSLKRINLSKLKGELVIGINRAYELLDPSILFGVDGQMWGWAELGEFGEESKRQFREYKGYKAWMSLHELFPPDFYLINADSALPHRIGTTRKLSSKNNGGYGAINLAAALGATEIYLLGFDMTGNKQGKQKWWHDGYPVDYGEGIYKKYMKVLTEFAPVLKDAGIKVVNLNRKSQLKCFPFGDFNRVMSSKPDRPIVISFYTRGTGYEKEAERLYKELHLFGFEHDVEGIDTLGSWQKNTHYKAEFIGKMMDKHSNRNLLWLDVDSSIRHYPELFDDAKFDLGIHTIDWSKHTDGRRRDHQLANAVIYLKNNDKVRGFVDAWVAYNKAHPDDIEMQTMSIVLDKWKRKLKYHNIPASYCQIFDLMANTGEPVIEQLQASRRYRNGVGDIDPTAQAEKKKYDDCWTTGYKKSGCALPLINHVVTIVDKGDRVLDIGCGDCTTIKGLRGLGIKATGVDISLKGAPDDITGVFEAPLWDMPFNDDQFDVTVSTDVLEHVPTNKIPAAIKEICRVTKKKTFHVVALFDGIRNGVVLHETVKPIAWWEGQFKKYATGVDATVISRNEFMSE